MKLPQIAVNRPVTTAMIFISMVVLGLYSLTMVGLDLMPELEIPAVSVMTIYEGAGPEEVETLITEPVEDSLSTIAGVDDVTSISKEGLSAVTLKFGWGEEINDKINDVRDKVDQAKALFPEEAEKPTIVKFDLAMMPIMIIAVTAHESYPDLQDIVDDYLVTPLKRVKGVAAATPRGGLIREIRVDLDRDKLAALELSVNRIKEKLAEQNLSIPGGDIKSGSKKFLLRTPEEFSSASEVAEVIIAQRNGIPVYLKDVADVRDFFEERTYDVRINDRMGMAVFIQKQSGENTVEVAESVSAELEKLKKNLPPDVKPVIVMDNSDFIIESVNNLRNTIFWAAVFVFIVLLFFLRSFRASLIVAVAIPTSLIITFLLMLLADYTINQDSLASLTVAVGIVVDNAIVIADNITRHRDRGHKAKEGSVFGANEVGKAVFASTLTTISIFLPILFVGGITAVIFGQFAAIVTMALVASLFTALMLVPMLSSKLLWKKNTTKPVDPPAAFMDLFYRLGGKTLEALENLYVSFLKWALHNRKTVFVSSALLFVWSLGLIKFIGTEFFPQQDQNQLQAEYELPVGTRYEKTGKVALQLQEIVSNNVPERKDIFIRWGVYGSAEGGQFATEEESYKGFLFVSLKDKEQRRATPQQIIERLRKITTHIPGADIRYSASDPIEGMIFGSAGKLAVELYGHNLEDAREYAQKVKTAIESIEGITDVRISRKEEKPELEVVVHRDKASKLGLSIRDIGKTIETFFAGTTATKYREGGDEYDVNVRLKPQDRKKMEDLRDIIITLPTGGKIPLSNVAHIKQGVGPTQIERKNQARYVTVSGEVSGTDLGSASRDVKKTLDRIAAPPGFSYKFAGAEEERRKAFRLLILAVGLGMVLVYMVMASQFESLRDPFIIFFSIPFAIVGVIIALSISGQSMSVVSFLSLIMVVGIVVNDGILLISYIGLLRRRGHDVYYSIINGGRRKVRPVICTSLTTILALSPMLFAKGEGSEIWVPFAITVIGGLSAGTIITLVLMPVLYSVFERMKKGQRNESSTDYP